MKPKLNKSERLDLIKRVEEGESVTKVCKEVGISRPLFYRWKKRYEKEGKEALVPISHGRPSKKESSKDKFSKELSPSTRTKMVEEVLLQDQNVTDVAEKYGVSRQTVYKWVKRYKKKKEKGKEPALVSKEPEVERYWRQTPEKHVNAVLSVVEKHPEYGIRRILKNLPQVADKPVVGHHGVQNILRRHNLSTYEQRLTYAERQITPITRSVSDILAKVGVFFTLQPEKRRRYIRIMGTFLSTAFLTVVVFGLGSLVADSLIDVNQPLVGQFFAYMALFMGSIFFLYSLKYYLTIAIVLSFSQQETTGVTGSNGNDKRRGLLKWILGAEEEKGNGLSNGKSATGLSPNLDHIKLERHPYISVQIPFYNEKYVVERAMEAATSFDYKGEYEVILCDDSTDETTDIIREYMREHLTKGETLQTIKNDKEGWELAQVEVKPGVTLKHLHRTSRSGYKGGALKKALELVDPRTEFISVFDADFVPYPDTLYLFLKYFKAQAGTLDFQSKNNNNQASDNKQIQNSKSQNTKHHTPTTSNIAAVQGYQWHVLNKSENWITRGVRSEYSGSYVIERSGQEIYQGLKHISGSVYMIRRDALEEVGWRTSITEDYELTLRLYESGYKVVYTPYVQAPAECVSTLKRLIRQRMRWAEGHSHNVKKMAKRLLVGKWEQVGDGEQLTVNNEQERTDHRSPNTDHKKFIPSPLTLSEKIEFMFNVPYYLQAFFFLVGTLSWLIAEAIFQTRLPFWTELWGWSLVLTNMLSLPLMNSVGLFLEESEERDYMGLASFATLSYVLVPFQAYSSVKGFLEDEEGPWFRTPKTGRITDVFTRGRFYRFIQGILPGRGAVAAKIAPSNLNQYLAIDTANNTFDKFNIKRRKNRRWLGRVAISFMLIISTTLTYFAPFIESVSIDDVNRGAPGGGVLVSPEEKVGIDLDDGLRLGEASGSENAGFELPSLVREVRAQTTGVGSEKDVGSGFGIDTDTLVLSGNNTTFKADDNPTFNLQLKEETIKKIERRFKSLVGKESKKKITARIINKKGKEYNGLNFKRKDNGEYEIVVENKDLLPGGEYSLIVQDDKGNGVIQDFSWGVLAINTNKSIYAPNETAKLSMAVLNSNGNTICGAPLELKINNHNGGFSKNITTRDGGIQTSKECVDKGFTLTPDYFSEFELGGAGTYEMKLTARTGEGEYVITDKFEVRDPSASLPAQAGSGQGIPFDIERTTSTRIYPPATYPMIFSVTPKEDYQGYIEESVPASFAIEDISADEIQEVLGNEINTGLIEELETKTEGDRKIIRWFVNWEKGQTYQFGYKYQTPGISPEFYLLGPMNIDGFKEARLWQLAVDAQFVRPSGDHDIGATWGAYGSATSPWWDDLDEGATGDGNGIVTGNNPGDDTTDDAIFTTTNVTDPNIHTGHILRARWEDANNGARTLTGNLRLYQGDPNGSGTLIATLSTTVTSGLQTDTYTLTSGDSGEASNITDYSDLYLRVTGGTSGGGSPVALAVDYIELETPDPQISISGKIYQTDESTHVGSPPCDGLTESISLRIDGGTEQTTTCSDGGGSADYTFSGVTAPSAGSTITIYINSLLSGKGNLIMVADGSSNNITDADFYQDTVVVRDNQDGTVTNADMSAYDNTDDDTNMLFDVDASSNLTVDTDMELHVWTGDTFSPGGTVTTQGTGELHIDDSVTAIMDTASNTIAGDVLVDGGATFTVNADTTINGGNITMSGSSPIVNTTSGTPTVTMGGTGTIGGGTSPSITFHDLAINDTVTTTISDTITVEGGDLTTTSGGSIDYSGTPTVNIDGTGTLGGGTGSITFYTLGIATGSSGGTTTVSSDIVVDNKLNIGSSPGNDGTFNLGSNNLTVGSSGVSNSGNITVDLSSTFSQTGGTTTVKSSSGGSAMINEQGSITFYNLDIKPTVASAPTVTLNDSSGSAITVSNNLTIGDGTNPVIVTADSFDPVIDVGNNFVISANAGSGAFVAPPTNSFTIAGDFTNSGAANSFDNNGGTVTLDATSGTPTITSGGSAFNNLHIDNGGTTLTWTLEDALDVDGNLLVDTSNTLDTKSTEDNNVNVAGNWTNNGTYTANSNTTTFDGGTDTTQTITGATTFNNLSATTGDRIVEFGASTTFTIDNNLTLTGTSCTAFLVLRSTTAGTAYTLTHNTGGTNSYDFLDMQDTTWTNTPSGVSNSVDSGGNSNVTIAANGCIGASTDVNDTATGHSFQRKTFYDDVNARYWLFYHDGDEVEIRYSSDDGSTWNVDDDHLAYDTNDFSVWWQQIGTTEYVWLAVATNNDIVVRRGTLSTNDVTWDATEVTALDGSGSSDIYEHPYISLGSSNNVWIGARYHDGSNYVYKAVRSDSTADSTWSSQAFGGTIAEQQISDDQTSSNVYGNIVPLSSQDMYATFVAGTALEGCLWDHSATSWVDGNGDSCVPTEGSSTTTDTWYNSDWTYRKKIGFNSSQISGTVTLQNFPVLINHTDSDLADTANSGKVEQSDGGDILFTDKEGNKLDHELEKYVNTTGELISWVEIANLYPNSENYIYIYYGNSTGVADQENPTGVWSNYESVHHLHDDFLDSTSNNRDGTNTGSVDIAALIADGQDFERDDNGDNIDIGTWSVSGEEITIQAWANFESFTTNGDRVINKADPNGDSSTENHVFMLGSNNDGTLRLRIKTGTDDGTGTTQVSSTGTMSAGTWHLISGTYDGSDMRVFIDGSQDGTTGKTGNLRENTWDVVMGDLPGTERRLFDGILDEARVSSVARSEDWFTTEYNNQNSPSTFYSVSTEETETSSGGAFKIDDANDFGTLPGLGRQVVRTASGDLYTVLLDTTVVEVWKSTDGFEWEEQDSANKPTAGNSAFIGLSAAIDFSGTIHIAYVDENLLGDDQVEYETFSTSSDTFSGTPESIDSTTGEKERTVVSVDSSDVPHVVYADGNVVTYANRVGGSWSTVDVESVADDWRSITINEDNVPEITYINTTDVDLTTALGADNDPTDDGTPFTLQDVDTSVSGASRQKTSISVDTLTGDTWVSYIDSDNTVALAKHADGDAWSTWSTITSKTDAGFEPSMAIAQNSQIYVFYQNDETDQQIAYDVYDSINGEWDGETALNTPPGGVDYLDVRAKWAFEWNNYGANRIDYLFSDSTDIYWDNLHLRREPTNIDDASDFGAMLGAGRQVVRTSSGILYSVVNDAGSCEVWKSADDGNSWSEQDSANNPTCDTSLINLALAIDSTDTLHIVYQNSTTSNQADYVTFTTSNDQFGTAEAADTSTNNLNGLSIAIDSNDKPHLVVRKDGSNDIVRYTNKVGGSWKAAVDIETLTGSLNKPDITINEDNIPEIAYLNSTDSDLTAAVGDVNDASSFTLFDVDATVNGTVGKIGTSIAIDSSGNTWIAYVDEDGTDDFVTLAKHDDASAWTSGWTTDITNSNVGFEPSIVVDGTDIYVFYEDDQDDVVFDKYDGTSWDGETVLEMHGALQDVKAKWSFLNNYDSSGTHNGFAEFDYLYSDGTDVFYNRFKIGSTPGSQDSIDTVPANITDNISAVSNGTDTIHLLFIDDETTDQVSYKKYSSASWGSAVLVADAADGNDAYVTLSHDTDADDLYSLWIDTSNSNIFYSTCDLTSLCDAASDWAAETTWKNAGTNTNITSNYNGATRVFGMWTVGSASPYAVQFDTIIVPELLWVISPLGPLLPLFLKYKRKRDKDADERKCLNISDYC